MARLNRRGFLLSALVAGGGLLLGYGVLRKDPRVYGDHPLQVAPGETALNAWIRIADDGAITVTIPRAEMGQGIGSALAVLVAEELDVPWHMVGIATAPIDPVYANLVSFAESAPFDSHDRGWLADTARWGLSQVGRMVALQITGGSTSVRDAWEPMRLAGAVARDLLLRAAAARLEVKPNALSTQDGLVIEPSTGRSLRYGALVQDAALLQPDLNVKLGGIEHWNLIGRRLPRLDVPGKINGQARYASDQRFPGTVFASIRLAPTAGGLLDGFGRTRLESEPGVIAVVPQADALIVVGRTWWHAEHALSRIEPSFSLPRVQPGSDRDLAARLLTSLEQEAGFAFESFGDVEHNTPGDVELHAEYIVPALAHACMEPMNCTVRLTQTGAEIWSGTQAPDVLRSHAARLLDVEEERIIVHQELLGGGFGRRVEPDALERAIAAAVAVPDQAVQLVYSRAQDMQHDYYRPPAAARLRARLDPQGNLRTWHCRIAAPKTAQQVMARLLPSLPLVGPDFSAVEGAAFTPYTVPNRRTEHVAVDVPLPVGFWRSVGHSYTAFFVECFIDELAAHAGQDPIEFRLQHLKHRPRAAHVLETVREMSGWASAPPSGCARGVALHECYGSTVAQVAEVAVDGRSISVERMVCVIDCGIAVSPQNVIAQMESGIAFGLSAALFGEINFDQNGVRQQNFHDQKIISMRDMPRIATHVISGSGEPGGVGECATPPVAPAVANALAALTGQRLRQLPLRLA